jgi:hypothetical protein
LLLQASESSLTRMDRLRRSLRSSLRKRKERADAAASAAAADDGGGRPGVLGRDPPPGVPGEAGSKPFLWLQDEVAVRSGTCSFRVKVRLVFT